MGPAVCRSGVLSSRVFRPRTLVLGPRPPSGTAPGTPPRVAPGSAPGTTPLAAAVQRRALHLAPPFLLDDYLPRFLTLPEAEAARKRARAYAHLSHCNLCPRLCGVNRFETTGMCLTGATTAKVNVIAPHFGEEPCVQGHNGSGAVFFSMCNLRCAFCQNHDISHQRNGMDLTPEELAAWFLKLQQVGRVHNINLITPEHVVPQVALALLHARDAGLTLPVIYNTSAYDSLDSLALLDGLVDIYLPDFKVWEPATSRRLLKADDYAATARESIQAMHAQVGDLCFTPDGIAKRGVLVRHLVMPGLAHEGATIMRWLARAVSRDLFVNIMEQYHPDAHVGKPRRQTKAAAAAAAAAARGADAAEGAEGSDGEKGTGAVRYADINRAVTDDEVATVRRAAEEAGLWRFCDPPKHDGFNL